MEHTILICFWGSLAVIGYTYLGYGALIYFIAKIKRRRPLAHEHYEWPLITIVIAAYNEADYIEQKIKNTLKLIYPPERKRIFIVTDGSTDGTPDIVKKFKEVKLFHQEGRAGKAHAVNRVMREVDTPITIFSDANTSINPEGLQLMVRHYQDENVGGVAGEKQIIKKTSDNAPGSGEGLYWQYESFLKKLDSTVHSVQGAAGEFFSVRTYLYEPPSSNIIIEDFYTSMRVIAHGYRFVYEPQAVAVETSSATIKDEWKRKVRISAGGLQAVMKLHYLLNPFRYGITSFQYFSHRVLRWTLAPLALLIALVCNFILTAMIKNPLYAPLLGAQVSLYGLALIGYVFRNKKISLKGFFVPFYFVMMNVAVYAGAMKFFNGKQSAVWEKAKRA